MLVTEPRTVRANHASRRARRARSRRRSERARRGLVTATRWVGILVWVSVLSMGFIFVHDLFTQSDFFRAERITVKGIQVLDRSAVLEAAQLTDGVNILSVNRRRVQRRLLSHPWVAEARVDRELPDRLLITVTEYEPLAILDLGRPFIIDPDGEIFKAHSPTDPDRLPVVTGLGFSDIGMPDAPPSPAFESVMRVLRLGRGPGCVIPNRVVERIDVDREMGITIYAPDFECGRVQTVKLGLNDYRGKLERLRVLITYLEAREWPLPIKSIDLNDQERIVVTPLTGGRFGGDDKEV